MAGLVELGAVLGIFARRPTQASHRRHALLEADEAANWYRDRQLLADGGENGAAGVAASAFEIAAAEMTVGLHVSDHGLDGRAASRFSRNAVRPSAGRRLSARQGLKDQRVAMSQTTQAETRSSLRKK